MNGMFVLGMPWWELCVRAAIVYFVLLILIRLSGKHTLGELSAFDLIVVVVLGSAVRSSLVGNDKSLPGGLIVVAVLLLLDFISTWVASHSARGDRLLEGRPVLLARDGVLFDEELKRCKIPHSSFVTMMRKQGCTGMEMVEQAILEPNGTITFRKRDPGEAAAHAPEP
ncbi:MAG TPA: YetF domain-containing protein [Rhodanobacteraceae bacterium]|nr:YetF domain-containing protein [Rhodanobacteraceae bacterium]